ncbi:hypothetical protein ES703_92384 [subsurface metagenome]
MTIIASVKVRDGVVLGTDSMTQIQATIDEQGNKAVIKTYSNAKKLFQIGEAPIGAMMYGIGNIGQRSIEGLMLDFCDTKYHSLSKEKRRSIKGIADALFEFFGELYQAEFANVPEEKRKRDFILGFFIAGYSKEKPFVQEWEFLLPRDSETKEVRPNDAFGASWRGVNLPFTRLLKGFDPRIEMKLREHGIGDDVIKESLRSWKVEVVYDGMPLQDAINFVVFILKTTIGLTSFEIGAPSCGGPLQVACILPDSTFRWIAQPQLSIEQE